MFPSSEHACHESKTGVFLMLQLVVQTVRVYTVSGGHRRLLRYAPASVCDRSSSLQRGLFPLVDRPGRRTLAPCLHIEHRCQANPLPRAPPIRKRIGVVAAADCAARCRPVYGPYGRKKTRISAGHRPQSAAQVVRGRPAWYNLPLRPLRCSASSPPASNAQVVTDKCSSCDRQLCLFSGLFR